MLFDDVCTQALKWPYNSVHIAYKPYYTIVYTISITLKRVSSPFHQLIDHVISSTKKLNLRGQIR